jgi:Tol biopolymer transport system component
MMRWIGGVIVLLLSGLVPPAPGLAQLPPGLAAAGSTLAVARSRAIGLVDPTTGQEQALALDLGPGLVRQPTWAPGGARLAFSWFARRPGERVGGSELLLLDGANRSPSVLVSRADDGLILDSPVWSRDGRTLYFESQRSAAQQPDVERIAADGRDREVVVRAATSPALAPDGAHLLYVRQEPTPAIAVLRLADGGRRVVVDDPRFGAMASPRFSPDGAWIAFTATLGPPDRDLLPKSRGPEPAAPRVLRHGPPWDVWLVRADGTGLRHLNWLDDDELSVAWGPDGGTLAAFGAAGLVLLSRDGGRVEPLARGGFGGLDWAW